MRNDPSAGSPTDTLLRLLLPLNDTVQGNSQVVPKDNPLLAIHCAIQSVTATGGVYKEQKRIQCVLMTRVYKEFLVQDE